MAMTAGKMGDMKSDINITPLVDVVLVLLIIFMVVTPLMQRGYETKVPPKVESTLAPPPMTDQIVIRLTEAGELYINKDQFSERDFPQRLKEVMKGRESKLTFFAADGTVLYDKVARIMDLCNENGVKNMGIVLDDINPNATQAGTVR
ncbi:MAG: biopolymer transporter ExbD [Acidobacteria bacterium]|nr:biopolymer transporter ExbD [Acidobacteriota bacterium]